MRILISGAGVAGLACARQLGTRGHDVTVVERADQLRTAGTPVDIRGHAIETAAKMGVLDSIRQRRVRMSRMPTSSTVAANRWPGFRWRRSMTPRTTSKCCAATSCRSSPGDLPDTVVVRFGDRVRTLLDHESGVEVRFASGRTGRYDVVIGADGQHSAVRTLVFGPDAECPAHLGVYFALAALPGGAQTDCANVIFNVPGRMVGCFRYAEKSVAVFQFRSAVISHDHRDLAAQKRILIEAFDGHRSWRIPELLDAARADPGFYFTAASQVRLPSWHRGRVVLVGDAGYCPSFLSGRGVARAQR